MSLRASKDDVSSPVISAARRQIEAPNGKAREIRCMIGVIADLIRAASEALGARIAAVLAGKMGKVVALKRGYPGPRRRRKSRGKRLLTRAGAFGMIRYFCSEDAA